MQSGAVAVSVTITITGARTDVNQFGAGIVLGAGHAGAHVLNNKIHDNVVGLFLANNSATDQGIIRRNLFCNNTQPGSSSGHGIYSDQFVAGGPIRNVLIDSNNFVNNDGSAAGTWGIGISNTDEANSNTNLQVMNNTFDSASPASRGMYFYSTHSSSIEGNSITNKTNYAIGLFGADDGITIECNAIQNNTGRGIYVSQDVATPDSNVSVNYNNISGNTVAGLAVDPSSYSGVLNAEANWWGSATGPTIASNPGGTGDIIDDAEAWLTTHYSWRVPRPVPIWWLRASQQSWLFLITDNMGVATPQTDQVAAFVNGPATPPRGIGSVRLYTGAAEGDGSVQFRNTNFAGVLLSDIKYIRYSTYVVNNLPNGQQFPYIELNVDWDNNGSTDDILFFEAPYQTPGTGNPSLPDQGPTALNTWQTWDARRGGWWANSGSPFDPGTGVKSFDDYVAAHPGAKIAASALGGVRLTFGFASANDVFDGNVDRFKIGVGSNLTRYDFELVP